MRIEPGVGHSLRVKATSVDSQGLANLLSDPARVAVMIQNHLSLVEAHHHASAARGERVANNLHDTDRAWCIERAGIGSDLPVFVALGLDGMT